MSEPIRSAVGFADSELQGYRRDGDTVVVRVRCWNDRVALVRFADVIGLRDVLAGEFSAVVRGAAASVGFLEDTLRRNFTSPPPAHSYRVYSFLNQDDEPSLEVVATACDVSIEE